MAQVLFINAARLKRETALGSAVDENIIQPYIVISQEREIMPVLGQALTDKISSLISLGTIGDAGNVHYKTLLDEYIIPSLIQFSFIEVIYVMRLRFSNNSITIPDSTQGPSASLQDIKSVIDRTTEIAMFYRQRLIDYVLYNVVNYPEYNANQYPKLGPTRRNYFQNLNVYPALPPTNRTVRILEGMGYQGTL
jgi:hypothetical protein